MGGDWGGIGASWEAVWIIRGPSTILRSNGLMFIGIMGCKFGFREKIRYDSI
jgi:hypothetical protein